MKKITQIILTTLVILLLTHSTKVSAVGLAPRIVNLDLVQERAHGNGIIGIREGLLNQENTKLVGITHNQAGTNYYKGEVAKLEDIRVSINNKDLTYNQLHDLIHSVYTDLRIKKLVIPAFDDVIIPASQNQDNVALYTQRSTQQGKDLYSAYNNKKITSSEYLKLLNQWNQTIVFPLRDYNKNNLGTDTTAITIVTALNVKRYNEDPEGTLAIVTTNKGIIQKNQNVLETIKQAQDTFDQLLIDSEK